MPGAALNPYQEILIAGAEADLASMRECFAAEAEKRSALPLGKFKVGFDSAFGIMSGGRLALAAEAGFAVLYDERSDDDGVGTIIVEGRGPDDALERAKALFAWAVHVNPDAYEGCCGSYFDWDVSADLDEVFWFEGSTREPGEPIAPHHGGQAFADELEDPDLSAIIEALSGAALADVVED